MNFVYLNGIAKKLVSGIPTSMVCPNVIPLRRDILKVVEIVPVGPVAAFVSDVWDFTPCFKNVCSDLHILDFTRSIPEARPYLKFYALHLMDRHPLKIRTIKGILSTLITQINNITNESMDKDFVVLTAKDIIQYFKDEEEEYIGCSLRTLSGYFNQVCRFFEFLDSEHIKHLVNLKDLAIERKVLSSKAKHIVTNHYPDIPQELWEIIKSRLDIVMRDDNLPIQDRLTAGIILMDTQLGLRRSELPILKVGMIEEVETSKGPMRCAVYRSLKASRSLVEPKVVRTICTPLLEQTYHYYLKLRRRIKESSLTDNLYVLPGVNTYPIRRADLGLNYKRVMARYVLETRQRWKGIDPVSVRGIGHNEELFYIPSLHSYRVHVASTYALRGYPYVYIEYMLSHAFTNFKISANDGYYSGASKADNPFNK